MHFHVCASAKGVIEDFGESLAERSGLNALSKCLEGSSERDVQNLVNRYELTLPIELTFVEKPPGTLYPGNIYMISLKSWAQWLVDSHLWHILAGLKK